MPILIRIYHAHKIGALLMEHQTMQQLYDRNAPKRPTNLSINSDLLVKARNLKINLSATLEQALANEVRAAEQEQWLNNNKEAIQALNELSEKNGLFSDSYREF
jgi:antitoxin CcdA